MLELEALPLPIVYTIIVVTMATLFLCCWRKKGNVSVTDGKAAKAKPISTKDSKKDKAESPGSTAEKPGNGTVIQSPSPAPQPKPELGDFSVVQRETEILRSYRKPAPPKNRARQSRAPRAMNRSTENLDIFTELSEDELKSDTEDNTTERLDNSGTDDHKSDHSRSGTDDVDGIKLRTHPENDTDKRETRSSMLADIEKTLATLHSTEESNTLDANKTSDLPKDQGVVTPTETSRSSPLTAQRESNSAQSSPSSKAKVAPKISPKPVPRKRGALNKTQENTSQDSEGLTESSVTKCNAISSDHLTSSQAQVTSSVQLKNSSAPNEESGQSEPAQVDNTSIDMAAETEQSKPESISTSQEGPQVSTDATSEGSVEDEKIHIETSTSVENLSKPTEETKTLSTSLQDANQVTQADEQVSTEDIKPVDTNESAAEDTTSAQTESIAETKEVSSSDHGSTEQQQLKTESNSSEQHPATSPVSSETHKEMTQGHETDSEQTDKDHEKSEKCESSEDQSGKGKHSKIPVRAGIKSGSSPPQDKPTANK